MTVCPFRSSHLLQQWVKTSPSRAPTIAVHWQHGKKSSYNDDSQARRFRIQQSDVTEGDTHQRQHYSPARLGGGKRMPTSLSTMDSSATLSFSPWKSTSSIFPIPSTSRATATRRHSTCSNENGDGEDDHDAMMVSNETAALQSLLRSRRTATKLTPPRLPKDPARRVGNDGIPTSAIRSVREEEEERQHMQQQFLLQALDRAVTCGQMAPNHKRTEPFSFVRFLQSSHAAHQLAEIAYQVTLMKPNSSPINAEAKRQKWLSIPAFVVTLVHSNQRNPITKEQEEKEQHRYKNVTSDNPNNSSNPYRLLPYMPPDTERQLEDYAAASAAVQNILLSLHAEGIGSKWATGPVIRTPAFRELVHAAPTDRVVALIMVGGTTTFASEREEAMTERRRRRRRAIQGDVLTDLP